MNALLEQQLDDAVAALGRHEVVVYPTETVYGLGVDPFSEEAIDRLYSVKERDRGNPVLLIVDGMDQLEQVVAAVPEEAKAYAEKYWPGPLSMLFPRSPRLPESLTGGFDQVCVRWTSHPLARELCRRFGRAITSTSANKSGFPPAHALEEVALQGIGAAIDGGSLPPTLPSTVFDPVRRAVLREGAISSARLLG